MLRSLRSFLGVEIEIGIDVGIQVEQLKRVSEIIRPVPQLERSVCENLGRSFLSLLLEIADDIPLEQTPDRGIVPRDQLNFPRSAVVAEAWVECNSDEVGLARKLSYLPIGSGDADCEFLLVLPPLVSNGDIQDDHHPR